MLMGLTTFSQVSATGNNGDVANIGKETIIKAVKLSSLFLVIIIGLRAEGTVTSLFLQLLFHDIGGIFECKFSDLVAEFLKRLLPQFRFLWCVGMKAMRIGNTSSPGLHNVINEFWNGG